MFLPPKATGRYIKVYAAASRKKGESPSCSSAAEEQGQKKKLLVWHPFPQVGTGPGL